MTNTSWLNVANSLLGTKEVPGTGNNPTIMGWAKKLGTKILGIVYNADSVPWCGVTVAYCMNEVGIAPPKISVRAKSWATWGVGLKVPVPGCVVVFERKGGGHVGFAVAESKTAYLVLGGNQGDKVSKAWIDKSRCIAWRWPAGVAVPKVPLPWSQSTGSTSTNEA